MARTYTLIIQGQSEASEEDLQQLAASVAELFREHGAVSKCKLTAETSIDLVTPPAPDRAARLLASFPGTAAAVHAKRLQQAADEAARVKDETEKAAEAKAAAEKAQTEDSIRQAEAFLEATKKRAASSGAAATAPTSDATPSPTPEK